MFLNIFTPQIKFNLILIITFSLSVNSYVEIQNINIIFYIIFHLTFIYLLFYHYNFLIYIIGLIYGVLFDTVLLNQIGSHLLTFIILISIYVLFKKYLFLLTPYQISITIFITLIFTLILEVIFAYFLNNIYLNIIMIIKLLIFSIIIFIPSIIIFNKLDK